MVTPHLPWKFHANRSSRFFVVLLTKKQRKKERKKSPENNTPSPYRGRGNNNNNDQSNLAVGGLATNYGLRPPNPPSRSVTGAPVWNTAISNWTTRVSLPKCISFRPTALASGCTKTDILTDGPRANNNTKTIFMVLSTRRGKGIAIVHPAQSQAFVDAQTKPIKQYVVFLSNNKPDLTDLCDR